MDARRRLRGAYQFTSAMLTGSALAAATQTSYGEHREGPRGPRCVI